MKTTLLATVLLASVLAPAEAAKRSGQKTPVLVELFTSEGCSSCPPADKFLAELHRMQPAPGVEILTLSHHVDYWNRLGWVDPFSSKAASKRQSWYSMRWPTRVYTPQMVIDGLTEMVGSDRGAALEAIRKQARLPKTSVELRAGEIVDNRLRIAVDVGTPPGERDCDVFLAIVEDGLKVDVLKGENSGRSLEHVGVVRLLEGVGAIERPRGTGGSFEHIVELEEGWDVSALRAVAFAQDRRTRRIVGAASIDLNRH